MEYSNSKYEGKFVDGRFADETATYTFPDGTTYVGSMVDGAFHGEGSLLLHNGSFRGVWDKGRVVSGKYTWDDDLEYDDVAWKYCDGSSDRRFHSEALANEVKGAGDLAFRDGGGRNEHLKDGHYEAGDGYYDVRDGLVHLYASEEKKDDGDGAKENDVDEDGEEETEDANDDASNEDDDEVSEGGTVTKKKKKKKRGRTRVPSASEVEFILSKAATTLNTALGKPLEDEEENVEM
jgi:hypothetical protein